MKNIIGSYDVTYHDSKAGTMVISAKSGGLSVVFKSNAVYPEVLRLVCESDTNVIPIGIPVPDGSCLCLRKNLSRNDISSLGLTSVKKCRLVPISEQLICKLSQGSVSDQEPEPDDLSFFEDSGSQWRDEYEPWSLFADKELQTICASVKGTLSRTDNDCVKLAIPISPSEPFPMMPVFCFGEAQLINGRGYVVFTAKNGQLV